MALYKTPYHFLLYTIPYHTIPCTSCRAPYQSNPLSPQEISSTTLDPAALIITSASLFENVATAAGKYCSVVIKFIYHLYHIHIISDLDCVTVSATGGKKHMRKYWEVGKKSLKEKMLLRMWRNQGKLCMAASYEHGGRSLAIMMGWQKLGF